MDEIVKALNTMNEGLITLQNNIHIDLVGIKEELKGANELKQKEIKEVRTLADNFRENEQKVDVLKDGLNTVISTVNQHSYIVFNDNIYKTNRRGGWSELNEVGICDFIDMLEGVLQKKMQKTIRKTFPPISNSHKRNERNRLSQEEIDELLDAMKAAQEEIEKRRKESENELY